mmetsp:Transcript_78164/g.126753  ORF Transcript_78164/g.126753 Transcript_78164/m.126753 type:complete len:223 (-) Transcript_78164:77-745(-)
MPSPRKCSQRWPRSTRGRSSSRSQTRRPRPSAQRKTPSKRLTVARSFAAAALSTALCTEVAFLSPARATTPIFSLGSGWECWRPARRTSRTTCSELRHARFRRWFRTPISIRAVYFRPWRTSAPSPSLSPWRARNTRGTARWRPRRDPMTSRHTSWPSCTRLTTVRCRVFNGLVVLESLWISRKNIRYSFMYAQRCPHVLASRDSVAACYSRRQLIATMTDK